MVSLGRRWYLVCYDLDRHDWRTFRLDRLTRRRAHRSPLRARAPCPQPTRRRSSANRSGRCRASYTVEALIAADADAVRDRVGPWATVEPAATARCLMRMRTDSLDWPAMVLGNLGAEFIRPRVPRS